MTKLTLTKGNKRITVAVIPSWLSVEDMCAVISEICEMICNAMSDDEKKEFLKNYAEKYERKEH